MPHTTSPSPAPFQVTSGAVVEVDVSQAVTMTLEELRARRVPDGTHLWVISALHHLPDPEVALDTMELGPQNLIGFQAIGCLWCGKRYISPTDPGTQCSG